MVKVASGEFWVDYKKRVEEAMLRHHEKLVDHKAGKKKRYTKPEKAVEAACLAWMRAKGFSVEIYEAKATFDARRGVWRNQAMKAGTCDCMGATPEGISVAVEFKAPGRLSTFHSERNMRQRDFIVEKIRTNCFACVVDSVERLMELYNKWLSLRSSPELARAYLFKELP